MMMQTTLSNVCQSETLALHTLFNFHRTLKLFYYHEEHTAGANNDKNELRSLKSSNLLANKLRSTGSDRQPYWCLLFY